MIIYSLSCFGHTYAAGYIDGLICYTKPGSISEPRGDDRESYAIVVIDDKNKSGTEKAV